MSVTIGSAAAIKKFVELYDFLAKAKSDDLRFSASLVIEVDGKTFEVEVTGEFDIENFRTGLAQDWILPYMD